jgi:protein-L-isoaspartate O-methyltransferase
MGDLVAAARAAGVADERVLAAIAAVPRAEFVPTEWARRADDDAPIPIPHWQVTTQPSLVARIVVDGSEGLAEHAPFDAILVAAAYPIVPAPLADQLAEGGRLVQPLGQGGDEDVVLFRKRRGGLHQVRTISGAHFVRLHGRYGFG